jgi:hypothetical protein
LKGQKSKEGEEKISKPQHEKCRMYQYPLRENIGNIKDLPLSSGPEQLTGMTKFRYLMIVSLLFKSLSRCRISLMAAAIIPVTGNSFLQQHRNEHVCGNAGLCGIRTDK